MKFRAYELISNHLPVHRRRRCRCPAAVCSRRIRAAGPSCPAAVDHCRLPRLALSKSPDHRSTTPDPIDTERPRARARARFRQNSSTRTDRREDLPKSMWTLIFFKGWSCWSCPCEVKDVLRLSLYSHHLKPLMSHMKNLDPVLGPAYIEEPCSIKSIHRNLRRLQVQLQVIAKSELCSSTTLLPIEGDSISWRKITQTDTTSGTKFRKVGSSIRRRKRLDPTYQGRF